MFFSNDLLSCCQSIGVTMLASSPFFVGDGVTGSLLVVTVLENESNNKDCNEDPDDDREDNKACLSVVVVLVSWDKLISSCVSRC